MIATTVMESRPTDPDAFSFLYLPAEIRNSIYQILLETDDALQLAKREDGRVSLVHSPATDEAWKTKYEDMIWKQKDPPGPCYKQLKGLQLLRTCRQAYHEAATMLYSEAFLQARRDGNFDSMGIGIDSAITTWLKQIGRQTDFVRHLVIDLGAVGPDGCDCYATDERATFAAFDGYIHCGTLVNAMWSSKGGLKITFVDSGFLPTFCSQDAHGDQVFSSICNTEQFNKIFDQLRQDDLGLKKLRKSIGEIGINRDGTAGVIVFRTVDWQLRPQGVFVETRLDVNPFFDTARTFETCEDGTIRLTNEEAKESRSLLDLPDTLLMMILSHTVGSGTTYEIDLDTPMDFQTICGILLTDWFLYQHVFPNFLWENTFNISMRTADTHANLDYGKLSRLLETGVGHPLTPVKFGASCRYYITLNIFRNTTCSPDDVRINIMSLVLATISARPNCIVKIDTHHGNSTLKSYTTSILDLRQRVLDILETYHNSGGSSLNERRCPELWMDNRGKTIAVVSTGYVMSKFVDYEASVDPAAGLTAYWAYLRLKFM